MLRLASTVVVRRHAAPLAVARRGNGSLMVGGIGVAACAMLGQYFLASQRKAAEVREAAAKDSGETRGAEPGEEAFFSGSLFTKRFYDGPFESKMSRREAALILGVRESANADRIKEAHRRILRINHPDMGGSTFLAGKINEAKELLIKGKQ